MRKNERDKREREGIREKERIRHKYHYFLSSNT
jgi:hypothetical protein